MSTRLRARRRRRLARRVARRKRSPIRLQLIILGTTGVLALVMAGVIAIHKPFLSKVEPVLEERFPEVVDAAPIMVNGGRAGRGPVSAAAISRANLRSLLRKLARTETPSRRKRLFEKARKRAEEFEPFLVEILTREDDELILPAIELVGELQIERAAPYLEFLAKGISVEVRAAAIRTCVLLRPWPEPELRNFLRYEAAFPEDPEVLEAVLEACAQSDERPVDLIIPLLGHSDDRVRTAAIDAIPFLTSGEQMKALCEFARTASGLDARAAARALGRTSLPDEAERCLNGLLANESWIVVDAALAALGNKKTPIDDVEPLLSVVGDNQRTVRERIYGFIALERTASVPVETVGEMMPDLHPILQLLGARCLVTVGNRGGISKLIELLETERSQTLDEDERSCVVSGARAVLTELAGEDLGEPVLLWRRWYGELEDFGPRDLQTSPPTSW